MVNLNPFKKKDNEFKLDDHELPSLAQSKSSSNNDLNMNNQFNQNSSQLNNPITSSLNESTSMNNDFQTQNSTNPFESPEQTNSTPNNTNDYNTNQAPISQSFSSQQVEQSTPTTTNINSDISRAKLESMESRVTLIDVRLSSIEQKLELLNKLILAEISDETKQKLQVDTMMNKIK